MKKLAAGLLLVFIALLAFSPIVGALSSHVVISGIYAPQSDLGRLLEIDGIYYAFYTGHYKLSFDKGVTWGNETSIDAGAVVSDAILTGLSVSTNTAKTKILIAEECWWSGNYAVAIRLGNVVVNGNGSIIWENWANSGFSEAHPPYVMYVGGAIDDTGHYYVGVSMHSGQGNQIVHYVKGSSTTDGTWVDDSDKTLTLGYGGTTSACCMPFCLGDTVAVFYSQGNSYLYARTWDSGADEWTAEVHTTHTVRGWAATSCCPLASGIYASFVYSDIGGINDYVEIAFLSGSSAPYSIYHTYYVSNYNIFGFENEIVQVTVGTTAPVLTRSSLTDNLYLFYWGSPLANHLYCKMQDSILLNWHTAVDLGIENEGVGSPQWMSGCQVTSEDFLSVLYRTDTPKMRFARYYGNGTGAIASGVISDVQDITDVSATLVGYCSWSGGSGANATLYYQRTGILPVSTLYGDEVDTGETFFLPISGLIPDTLYWCWLVMSNSSGNSTSDNLFFYTWTSSGPSAPIVETQSARQVTSTSAETWGYLAYDGGLKCYAGFDWRVQGATSWTRSWFQYTNVWPWSTDRPVYTGDQFWGTLSGLTIDTTYEYRTFAKNSLTEPYVVYGNTTTFTTSHYTAATPTPGGFTLPPGWEFPFTFSNTMKTILGIIITVVGMVLIVFAIRTTGGTVAAGAFGLGMTIVFVVIGWYPLWIILLIGAIVGLLTFLIVLGGRQ